MATFSEALQSAVRGTFCSYIGTLDGFLTWLFEEDPIPTTPPPLVWARFMRRWFCNQEPAPFTSRPFTGGQCAGVTYVVQIYVSRRNGNGTLASGYPFTFSVNAVGPILGVAEDGTQSVKRIFLQRGGGETYITNANTPDQYHDVYYIAGIQRQDGLPDTCGDLLEPPSTPLPSPRTPVRVPYTDANGRNFTIPVSVIFAPVRVDIDGTLNIPFRLQLDANFDFDVNGTINLNTGDINIDFGNTNYPPTKRPKQNDYQSPDDVPDYPPDVPNGVAPIPPSPPEDETTGVIRAVIVTVTDYASNATIIDQAENPDIYAPNLGFVQFAISVKNAVAWTSDIPVKNFRNFIPCPWEGGALEVRGTPRPGVTWTLSPVRIAIEEPIVFS